MKRDKEHRNEIARKNDSRPERIEVKKQWKEDNYEKVAEYCMNSRQHKIERVGVEEYLKDNAEHAQKWRDNNPDKMIEFNDNRRNNYENQYVVYRTSAELKQLEFTISFDEYKEIVKMPCHYCGIIQDRGTEQFNGIDRENNDVGYIMGNCVSCCKVCNYMKKSLTSEVFLNRIEHILTYNNLVDGNLFPDSFANHSGVLYSKYKHRADGKGLNFMITKEEFDTLTIQNCYICGKQNSDTHTNGVDRYNNNAGYELENCKTCCGECNYMKREFAYNDIFDKFKLIYENNNCKKCIAVTEFELNELKPNNMSLKTSNKKTQEQLKEERRIRKQKQREALRTKYGDEEYKKMRAKEIATNREQKQEK